MDAAHLPGMHRMHRMDDPNSPDSTMGAGTPAPRRRLRLPAALGIGALLSCALAGGLTWYYTADNDALTDSTFSFSKQCWWDQGSEAMVAPLRLRTVSMDRAEVHLTVQVVPAKDRLRADPHTYEIRRTVVIDDGEVTRPVKVTVPVDPADHARGWNTCFVSVSVDRAEPWDQE